MREDLWEKLYYSDYAHVLNEYASELLKSLGFRLFYRYYYQMIFGLYDSLMLRNNFNTSRELNDPAGIVYSIMCGNTVSFMKFSVPFVITLEEDTRGPPREHILEIKRNGYNRFSHDSYMGFKRVDFTRQSLRIFVEELLNQGYLMCLRGFAKLGRPWTLPEGDAEGLVRLGLIVVNVVPLEEED